MNLKPYPKYKDSGVEWIDSIPNNWDLVRNKNIFYKSKIIVGDKWKEYPVLSLTKKGVIKRDVDSNMGKMPSDFSIYQIIKPNNLLMCLFDIDVTPRCIGFINDWGIVSAAYSEISPIIKTIFSKYYYYWYLMLDFDKELLHLSKNLRNSISNEDFMALPIVLPPFKEQKIISYFLDIKTSEIDKTIKKDAQLIKLLKEKSTALINHVVTKGLDPNAKMKDSGIDWIGDIPYNWSVFKIKQITAPKKDSIIDGPFGSSINVERDYVDELEGVPVIRTNNISDNLLSKNNFKYLSKSKFKMLNRHAVYPGDILFSKVGSIIGHTCILPQDIPEAILSTTGSCKITLDDNFYNNYIVYVLKSMKEYFNMLAVANVQPFLNMETIKNVSIPLPELDEQKLNTEYLNEHIYKIDKTIEKIGNKIYLMEEYRKSLIHHVVTGKVDVREVTV